MADSVSLKAFAKINLNLDITGVSADKKYHTVEMVLQSVDIYDTITVALDDEISVKCNADLPENEDNIAYKAAKAFFEETEIQGGANIKIKKRIPSAAGLGGGSSDAAAVIVALDMLYNTDLENDELEQIAEKVGSDVPFFIVGGAQLAEGRGTILTPLPEIPECAFVIVKDGFKLSTGDMYSRFDSLSDVNHPNTNELVNAICEGDLAEMTKNMKNVFEPLYDENVEIIKTKLIENGALCAVLSGSGPSVFGMFSDYDSAKEARDVLEKEYENVFLCEPTKCGFIEK
ncbi:MAG: 4-(cytidine 5'-diphospho)-2-C-methyl-D-erythritol kinase [Clostridia bacterium]|nr:4-(cytidine 5'-diphospho)-2-C-methyl-D-erythritol kinase [Clostridia bacterium]